VTVTAAARTTSGTTAPSSTTTTVFSVLCRLISILVATSSTVTECYQNMLAIDIAQVMAVWCLTSFTTSKPSASVATTSTGCYIARRFGGSGFGGITLAMTTNRFIFGLRGWLGFAVRVLIGGVS
jgi:hypothetical protein